MKIFTSTNLILLGILTATYSGCASKSSISEIDDTEAFSYIKKYEAEYQQIKANSQNIQMPIKWVQATNKKEPCKLFVGYDPNDDHTLKDGFKIFWDGSCKNGYAYGLGREFERGFLTNTDAIALYAGEEKEPEYFIQKFNLENITLEGNITNGDYVKTTIKDDGINFNINYQYSHFPKKPADIAFYINSSPFSDIRTYVKEYPNFAYLIEDGFSGDVFERYNVMDSKSKKANGFGFLVDKNNIRYSAEKINGQIIRSVYLPQNYVTHMINVFNEVKNVLKVAYDAQQKALMVKQQYKDNICKDSIKVDFMDNNEYKAICRESEKNAQLKIKSDDKLAQIEQQKQAKREQLNQQRLVNAKETESIAAQSQAASAQMSAQALQQANTNQQIQNNLNNLNNLNNNMQMQNLNNNLNNINRTLNNNSGGYYNEKSLLQK